ncbi:MAG: tRNA (adenosine(37)-N6)-threonylcarbamoyltransferase complex ATPase subunit type 1 TsaE [Candidatus Rifleibacteriota bacterium]
MTNSQETHSPEDTIKLAADLARQYKNCLVLLKGPMGSGKTVFCKGFASGLGIARQVSSPTYTIMNEYRSDGYCLYHLDLYRINSLEEVIDTGLFEILESNDPCLVEWPERVSELENLPHLAVNFYTDMANEVEYRKITWEWKNR